VRVCVCVCDVFASLRLDRKDGRTVCVCVCVCLYARARASTYVKMSSRGWTKVPAYKLASFGQCPESFTAECPQIRLTAAASRKSTAFHIAAVTAQLPCRSSTPRESLYANSRSSNSCTRQHTSAYVSIRQHTSTPRESLYANPRSSKS